MRSLNKPNQIGLIIFQFFGGYYILQVMIDLYKLKFLKNGIQFQIRCKSKANFIRITLNEFDFYDVEFGNINKEQYLQKSLFTDIKLPSLKSLIETETGLFLSIKN